MQIEYVFSAVERVIIYKYITKLGLNLFYSIETGLKSFFCQ